MKPVALFKMLAMFRNLTEGRSKREIKLLDDEDKQRKDVERILTYYINKVGFCYRCYYYN